MLRNVIVFGQTGAGKSSLINMVMGSDVAAVSSGAAGCTFKSEAYDIDINGFSFRLYDTAGLNEITTVNPKDALTNLYKLMHSLQDGVSLLVYVVRGRVTEFTVKNYKLFFDVFCQQKVPIVLVITGLEQEDPMDAWWDNNRNVFELHGMSFRAQACITTTKGRQKEGVFMFQDEYNESKTKVLELLSKHPLRDPWKVKSVGWFMTVAKKLWNCFASVFNWTKFAYCQALYEALRQFGGLSEKQATEFSNQIVEMDP